MASIVSQIVVVWVNRVISEGSVNWPQLMRLNYPQTTVVLIYIFLLLENTVYLCSLQEIFNDFPHQNFH